MIFSIYADGESIFNPLNEGYYLFSPKCKLEFGKAGSMEFVIPPSNIYYNKLMQLKTIITVEMDDVEIFRGRVFSIDLEMNKFKTVYCEGDLTYLIDSVQKAEKYTGTTRALFNKIIAAHNTKVEPYKRFTVGDVTIDDRSVVLTGKSDENESLNTDQFDYRQIAVDSVVDEWSNTFDYIQSVLIDYCGGYLRTRRVGTTTYIDYFKEYSTTATQEIKFGENILDLKEEATAEDLFTVLIPLGDENLTISSVNSGSDELVDTAAVAKYGRIVRTHVFPNVNDANTLLENGKRYLKENVSLPITITVNAIDLHLVDSSINAIRIGDRVHLVSQQHGLNDYLICTSIEYDLSDPENNSYTFGNPKQSLTERYREDKRKSNDTYGSDGIGSAAGGLGSALGSRSSADAKKKVDDGLKDFYDAYINLDPEHARGSLGAIYKDYEKSKLVLTSQVGINFDAVAGNINMFALQERVNAVTDQAERVRADFRAFTEDVDGQLNAVTQMQATYQSGTDRKIALIEARANAIESSILLKADKVNIEALQTHIGTVSETVDKMKNTLKRSAGIDVDSERSIINMQTLAQKVDAQGNEISSTKNTINQVSRDTYSRIDLIAEAQSEDRANIARIAVRANALESEVLLKADKVTVDAELLDVKGDIEAVNATVELLKAKKVTADEIVSALAYVSNLSVQNLSAASITSPNIRISDSGGTYPVASHNWVTGQLSQIGDVNHAGNQHAHTITEGNDGTLILGYATSQPQSFNIRATRTYREGVAQAAASAAANINKISLDASDVDTNVSYNETTKIISFKRSAKAYQDTTLKYTEDPVNVSISGNLAYQHGLRVGAASQASAIEEAVANVTISSISQTDYSVSTSAKNVTYTVTARASNNAHSTFTRTIDASAIWDAGRANVTINNILRRSDKADYYNSTSHTTTIYVRATASNNESLDRSFTTNTVAYDTGLSKGTSDGIALTESAISIKTADITKVSQTDATSKKQTTVKVKAQTSSTRSGYKVVSATQDLIVDASAHYNYGYSTGKTDYNPTEITVANRSVSGAVVTYDASSKTLTKHVTITAKNAAKSTVYTLQTDITTAGTLAYNAGKADYTVTTSNLSWAARKENNVNQIYDPDSKTITKYITLSAKYANGGTVTRNSSVAVSGTAAYNAGVTAGKASGADSVTVKTVTNSIADSTSYNKSVSISDSYLTYTNNILYGRATINLSSGKNSSILRIGMNGTKAYNAGKDAGKVIDTLGYNPNGSAVYHGSYGTETRDSAGTLTARYVRFPIIATSKGGGSKSTNLYISTDREYTDGWNAAKGITSLGTNGAASHGQYGTETQDSTGVWTARYVRIPIIATSAGGGSSAKNIYISTDKEYSDGWNAGYNSAPGPDDVYCERVVVTNLYYNYYTDRYEIYGEVYLSNGDSGTWSDEWNG